MKQVRLYVVVPEGRFIPGFGGRAVGEYYTLPAVTAQELADADPGLSLTAPGQAQQRAQRPKADTTDD